MFTSSTLSTPPLRRTAPDPSPFTPKTNFNKVALIASPAQQQRQAPKGGSPEPVLNLLT